MQNLKYSKNFYEIEFSDPVSKNAYLKACKWLAQNIYNNQELSKYVSVQIQKAEKTKIPTFNVILSIELDMKELKNNYCSKCKELYTIFYAIDTPDCKKCKLTGCIALLENSIEGITKFHKEVLDAKAGQN